MFAKVSDKFHARKQAAKAQVTSPPRQQAQLPSRPAQPAAQASRSPPQSPPVAQPASQPQPPAAPAAKPQVASPPSNNNGAGASPMEGIEGWVRCPRPITDELSSPPAQANALSHSLSSAATGSSASSSLSAVPPQDRTLSSALGVQGQSAATQGNVQPEVNRTMSIEMADVSTLSIQNPPDSGRQGSSDEDRIREKAREAQEQVSTKRSGTWQRPIR